MKKIQHPCRPSCGLAVPVCAALLLAGQQLEAGDAPPKQTQATLETYLRQLGYVAIRLSRGRGNHLFVEAQLGGKTRLLVVDTGCSVTTLDKSVAKKFKTLKELGVKLEDPNLGLLNDPSVVLIEDMKLGSAKFANQPAWVGSISPSWGSFADGLMGCDFFIRHFCLIDCAGLRLYARAEELKPAAQEALEASLSQSGYQQARLQSTRVLVLTADAKINTKPVKLLVDTGSPFTVVDEHAGIRARLYVAETSTRLSGIGKIGAAPILGAKPTSFELDGVAMQLHGLYLGMADLSGWKIGEKGSVVGSVDGFLGGDLLAANGALIDIRQRKLWIESTGPAAAKSNTSSK